jgi:DNA-binding response OmpR family regulator
VLVVDDEPLIAMLLADWLGDLGYQVAGTVGSVADALALVAGEPLDAILLDVTLRSGDSFSIADAAGAKGLRLAFITGHDSKALPERFRQAPILAKPFEFEGLKAFMHELLKGPPQASAPPA